MKSKIIKSNIMKSKIIKSILATGLTVVMILTTVSSTSKAVDQPATNNSMTQEGAADIKSKSEVVYASLAANGSINAVYVVNHFELEKGGSITDYGNYESVLNLTESKPITMDGDTISFEADAENFYYQGNMVTTDLPWTFDITYELDGVAMSPQEIAGKTGMLEIHIKADSNEKVSSSFFDHYMLQISVTLDSDQCKNINAPEATIADAGNNKILAFTVMPKKGAEFQVKSEVKDFAMSGIEISAMPFSMSVDLQDTDEMLADFNQLPDAIAELNTGVGKLADGTSKLKNGAYDLKNGSSEFNSGLSELSNNSKTITGASSQINDALIQMSSSLNGSSASDMDISELTQLPIGLSQLADGLEGISSGLKELQNGYSTAYSALDLAIQGIPNTVITSEEIDAQFTNANADQRKLLDQLYATYVAGQTAKGTYNQVKEAFAMVSPTIDTITSNIDTISGTLDSISLQIGSSLTDMDITEQLSQLTKGLSDLASNYAAFDNGLKEYMEGIETIAGGYSQFHSGLSEFSNGVGELNGGVDELYEGTGKLNDEVSKMPDMMQEKIEELTSEYDSSDFVPISYVSSKNENTELVQFVLKCEGIELPEVAKESEINEEMKTKETVWDRIVALFQ